mmetsp:Transcript_17336/g.37703  ORF Transcript_17336/g.37703 Transcript_17336/m.37703 type:complete len:260 (-) Transcript_17336:141-920(-)
MDRHRASTHSSNAASTSFSKSAEEASRSSSLSSSSLFVSRRRERMASFRNRVRYTGFFVTRPPCPCWLLSLLSSKEAWMCTPATSELASALASSVPSFSAGLLISVCPATIAELPPSAKSIPAYRSGNAWNNFPILFSDRSSIPNVPRKYSERASLASDMVADVFQMVLSRSNVTTRISDFIAEDVVSDDDMEFRAVIVVVFGSFENFPEGVKSGVSNSLGGFSIGARNIFSHLSGSSSSSFSGGRMVSSSLSSANPML